MQKPNIIKYEGDIVLSPKFNQVILDSKGEYFTIEELIFSALENKQWRGKAKIHIELEDE